MFIKSSKIRGCTLPDSPINRTKWSKLIFLYEIFPIYNNSCLSDSKYQRKVWKLWWKGIYSCWDIPSIQCLCKAERRNPITRPSVLLSVRRRIRVLIASFRNSNLSNFLQLPPWGGPYILSCDRTNKPRSL